MILALAACSVPGRPTTPAIGVVTPAAATAAGAVTATGAPSSPPATTTAQPAGGTEATRPATETATAGAEPSPTTAAEASADPFELVSLDSLFHFLEDLTAIQPYSGWRNSGSKGEAEALDYVATTLAGYPYLQELGLELERQQFHVYLATELWEARLELTLDGQQAEVPANGVRGPRDVASQARRFDSDGVLNDDQRDPVVATGAAVVIRSADEIERLTQEQLQGKIIFLDYAVIDRSLMETQVAVRRVWPLLEKRPAGLVLVTQFSNTPGESHGAFVADINALDYVETPPAVPLLYVRLEDLAAAGIAEWDDLARIEAARMTWDADVFLPGTSGNLVAHIPGRVGSRAVILGAHIDSPNVPGAMDDGSGVAVLLEVARVIDAARVEPPVDLYLAWFGSEELGLYGGSHFVATHQELLDRTLAMLQIDCLTRPLDGIPGEIKVVTWPYGLHGEPGMPWPEYLQARGEALGLEIIPEGLYQAYSDNTPFGSFDVPNADLILLPLVDADQSIHAAGHIHDPYDTVALARDVGGAFEAMARLALSAALEAGRDHRSLRLTPPTTGRAVFVASHTEAVHMGPITNLELGAALALQGLDVDMVPYGQAVTAADLEGANLVVALPVFDYPGPASGDEPYDEAWTAEEVAVLEEYVAGGGLLVVTNSANRLKYTNQGMDPNEDWPDVNALAEPFGLSYTDGVSRYAWASVQGDHPLVANLRSLEMGDGNGIPFELDAGVEAQVLADFNGEPIIALLDHGPGQVLALADVGILASGYAEPRNVGFWRNLARYALGR
jgi:hypothetical protein